MTRLLLDAADRRIHRCTCGTWVYGVNVCGTCGLSTAASTGAPAFGRGASEGLAS